MSKLIFYCLLFFATNSFAFSPELASYRKLMGLAYSSETQAHQFYSVTRNINDQSPSLLLGFKAISELMMCKYLTNPLNKLSYFNKGKKLLEKAIERDPNNAELRFMRFCTQVNTPAMLGYNSAITKDKIFLIDYLNKAKVNPLANVDEALYSNVKAFLLDCKYCSTEEKNTLKRL